MNQSKPTFAYAAACTIKLAPLVCPYCERKLGAQDVEPLDTGNARIVCPGCHIDILTIKG